MTDTGFLDRHKAHIFVGNKVKVELKNGMMYIGYVIPKPMQENQYYITDDGDNAKIEIPQKNEGTIEVLPEILPEVLPED